MQRAGERMLEILETWKAWFPRAGPVRAQLSAAPSRPSGSRHSSSPHQQALERGRCTPFSSKPGVTGGHSIRRPRLWSGTPSWCFFLEGRFVLAELHIHTPTSRVSQSVKRWILVCFLFVLFSALILYLLVKKDLVVLSHTHWETKTELALRPQCGWMRMQVAWGLVTGCVCW